MNTITVENVCYLFNLKDELVNLNIQKGDSTFIEVRNSGQNYYIQTRKSYIGFNLGYFVWVMCGANSLEQLSYYSRHVEDYTDNFLELRGAYGPRIFYWVGPDQLQEAIKINQDIDDEREFVKPEGINQLDCVYEDLKTGIIKASSIVIRDPAIDFDVSNDIPDLTSVTFSINGEKLNMHMDFVSYNITENGINDVILFQQFQYMLAKWLDKQVGHIYIFAGTLECSYVDDEDVIVKHNVYGANYPEIGCFEDCLKDIGILKQFESHMRSMIKVHNFTYNEEVSVQILMNSLEIKLIDKIKSEYWQDVARALLICAVKKYTPSEQNFEEYILSLIEKMGRPMRQKVCHWLNSVGDCGFALYEAIKQECE